MAIHLPSTFGFRSRKNRTGLICLAIAIALFISGSGTIIRGLQTQKAIAATKNLGYIPGSNSQPKAGNFMAYAQPVVITIPKIGVDSLMTQVGKTNDGHIDTPQRPNFDKAAWYRNSPAPGQYGASVIVGHVDSYDNNNGASVFYSLGRLTLGDEIIISRSDDTTASFEIYATRQYERQSIPDDIVYQTHSNDAELRLITCAGSFDQTTSEYDSNTIIFARLKS